METKTLKDKDLQAYYDSCFEMYASAGWLALAEKLTENLVHVLDIRNVDEKHTVDFRKGEAGIIAWMLGQKDLHEAAYEALLLDDGGDTE